MTSAENTELSVLASRVEALDGDVRRLRTEFEAHRTQSKAADAETSKTMKDITHVLDRHVELEDKQYRMQDAKISLIQGEVLSVKTAILTLSDDLKEPMEVYRTTKYGAQAAGSIADFFKKIAPIVMVLCGAVLVVSNAMQSRMLNEIVAPLTVQQSTQAK